jgi:hypothetical protein
MPDDTSGARRRNVINDPAPSDLRAALHRQGATSNQKGAKCSRPAVLIWLQITNRPDRGICTLNVSCG